MPVGNTFSGSRRWPGPQKLGNENWRLESSQGACSAGVPPRPVCHWTAAKRRVTKCALSVL